MQKTNRLHSHFVSNIKELPISFLLFNIFYPLKKSNCFLKENKIFASGQAISDAKHRSITLDLIRLARELDAKSKGQKA